MTLDKWRKLTLAQQLGNIGSEISRARHWERQNDSVSRQKALERALELIDCTLSVKYNYPCLKEILYLREIICDFIAKTHLYSVTIEMIEKFCLDFGLKARVTHF